MCRNMLIEYSRHCRIKMRCDLIKKKSEWLCSIRSTRQPEDREMTVVEATVYKINLLLHDHL
jgi:hypothetical protein